MSKTKTNKYPTVFIHGLAGFGSGDRTDKFFPYWGFSPKKNLLKYLRKQGFEVYNPSLGPVNSAWDRACEFWAQMFGGTVDYGKVHSEKYGHARYGRTYEKGLIPDWGKKGAHEKINIIGHSFGGPTVKEIANLIANGCQEEVDGTPPEELSDLFKPNKPQKIHTVTTLTGVNNGTSFASMFGWKGMTVITYAVSILFGTVGESFVSQWYDGRMDQWGVMPDGRNGKGLKFNKPWAHLDGSKAYNKNEYDSIAHEMQIETVQNLVNPSQKVSPSTYYFARRGCRTHDIAFGKQWPNKNMSLLCSVPGAFCGTWNSRNLKKKYGVNKDWMPNDGFVNVIGQSAPLDSVYEDWKSQENCKPGIWYNMPVEDKDHISWNGWGEDKEVFFKYYKDMLTMFSELPDGDK